MKLRRLVSVVLLVCSLISVTALAAGLNSFEDKQEMRSYTDVGTANWFYGGVRVAVQKGIMTGVSETRFDPSGEVTWAQAVTIAARLHMAYSGAQDPGEAATGYWYSNYLNYARENDLLPGTAPSSSLMGIREIDRQSIAYLLAGVLSESDLPAINDAEAPDLGEVDEQLLSAVKLMYAAGVITGQDGGIFNPTGRATRAEAATMVARLLEPSRRVGGDSACNPIMTGQEDALSRGGLMACGGDYSYYVYTIIDSGATLYKIARRSINGGISTIYTSSDAVSNLTLYGRYLYFIEGGDVKRVVAAGGSAVTMYSGKAIQRFTIYNGEIYVLAQTKSGDYADDWGYRYARVSDSATLSYLTEETTYYLVDSRELYVYGGKLYYLVNDKGRKLYSCDLATKKSTELITGNIESIVFSGNMAYYILSPGKGTDNNIYAISLRQPEYPEVTASLDSSLNSGGRTLMYNGVSLYYYSGGLSQLYRVGDDGSVTLSNRAPEEGYDNSFISAGYVFFCKGVTAGSLRLDVIYVTELGKSSSSGVSYGRYLGLS